ncbi:MAG TPA: TIGR04283 family arsenosugar biosynthesis glycosyltransferase [Allosphingosinicella sp.]|nr:TIGR04283 family arsenosugar biosynthesis glycosyltransferase [Allosphingosinicella sp.]
MTLSIVIPTFQEAARIGAAVDAARALGEGVEIVVVDGASSDGTAAIARRRGARVIAADAPGRARQMNQGAAASSGDVLLFLHADTLLPADAARAIAAILSDPRVAGGCFRLRFDDDHPVLRLSSALSGAGCRLFHYGDCAYFVRRPVFRALGGFHAMPLLEDLDFWLRLNRGHRVVVARASVVTSARRFKEVGVVRQQALGVLIVLLYLLGVGAPRLARLYRRFTRFRTPEVA